VDARTNFIKKKQLCLIVSREATSYVNVLALTAVSLVERGIIHCCIKATPIPVDQLPQLVLQQAHKIQLYRGIGVPVQKICPVCRTI